MLKGNLFSFILLLITTISTAQVDCKDVIYTLHQNDTIHNCCIISIEYGNVVHYRKLNRSYTIPARAVINNGKYQVLQLDHQEIKSDGLPSRRSISSDDLNDYDYYRSKYQGALIQRNIGMFLSMVGIAGTFGVIITRNVTDDYETLKIADQVMYGSAVFIGIGVPLWISGAIKSGNNKKAMEELNNGASLSLIGNENGIGLRFSF